MAELLLDRARLVTLTGTAGIGKTRLAIAIAHRLESHFDHGVLFVSLSSVREPAFVLPAIAGALGVGDDGDRPLRTRLIGTLQRQCLLLMLDNFEQVADAAAEISDLLESCPALKVLVTSRVRLRVRGEHPVVVPPLRVPDRSDIPPVDLLRRNPSVALFIERAAEVDPAFTLGPENATAVASICAGLEGIPLAIELAAARLEVLSPQALAARLGGRLAVLSRGPRDAEERHRTLRDAIGWSYELLASEEQRLFRALAVFVGGCTAQAAEAVIGPLRADPAPDDVLNGLGRLIDQSLVQRETHRGEPRFRMLESIREYGLEQLARRQEAAAIQRRHAEYFLALASPVSPPSTSGQESDAGLLEPEHDNLRAALAWAIDNDPEMALRLATALHDYWMTRGSFSEGRAWLDRSLAAEGPVAPQLRAEALKWSSYFAFLQQEYGQAKARAEESLALWRSIGDERGSAFARILLGNVAAAQDDPAAAIPYYEEGLALHRAASGPGDVGGVLANLGLTLGLTGQYEQAASLLEEAIALCEAAGDQRTVTIAQLSLGEIARLQGDRERAATLLASALDRYLHMGDMTGGIAECWEGLAGITAGDDPVRAARLLGAANALRERLAHPLAPALRPRYDATLDATRSALEPAVFAAAWEAGGRLVVEQASAEALAIANVPGRQTPAGRSPSAAQRHGLTARELEVLRLVAAGRSDREIGDALFISRYTAMVHVKNIRRKLGVDSRAAIASYAVRLGLA